MFTPTRRAAVPRSLPAFLPSDAAPKLFEQDVLFEDALKPTDTVFDLLGDVISDVSSERRNSPLFGSAMLKTVANYERARRAGLGEMRFSIQACS
jgi:hypothetical protein